MDTFSLTTQIVHMAEDAKRERETLTVDGPGIQPDGSILVVVTYRGVEPPEELRWRGERTRVLEEVGSMLTARRSRIRGEN